MFHIETLPLSAWPPYLTMSPQATPPTMISHLQETGKKRRVCLPSEQGLGRVPVPLCLSLW